MVSKSGGRKLVRKYQVFNARVADIPTHHRCPLGSKADVSSRRYLLIQASRPGVKAQLARRGLSGGGKDIPAPNRLR